MPKKTINPYNIFNEHQIQKAAMAAFQVRGRPGAMLFAIPNGGARRKVTAKRLKDEGVTAGAPDLCAIYRGRVFFIEVKRHNGTLSKAQESFHGSLLMADAEIYVARGYLQLIEILEIWGILLPPSEMVA